MSIKDCLRSSICNIPVRNELVYLGITILLSKAEGLSRLTYAFLLRLTYASLSLHLDNKHIIEIDKLLFNFSWKNRTQYVKKFVLTNDYENRGLNFLDFCTLNNTFKIN